MKLLLSQTELRNFDQNGYLIVPEVLDREILTTIRNGLANRVLNLLERYRKLGITGIEISDNFERNITTLLKVSSDAYQHIDISLPMLHDLNSKLNEWKELFGDEWYEEAGMYTDESIFSLITNRNILSIVTQLLGDEVVSSPVQHVRIKPPQRLLSGSSAIDANTARTLWHQDEAVVTEEARGVDILTVWVAISDATVENGCMWAIAGSHLVDDEDEIPDYGLTQHCPGKGKLVGEIYIPDQSIDKDKSVPLVAKAGDVVLLNKRTVHGAGPNCSSNIRWSFDMRYQATNTPSGRNCFPSTIVASKSHPDSVVKSAKEYRESWLKARDAILNGETEAIFNDRWNKYAPICA